MNELHDMVGAYAVDALTPQERRDFQAHLAGCPACAAELAGSRELLAALADALAVVPPASIAAEVLAVPGAVGADAPADADGPAYAPADAVGPADAPANVPANAVGPADAPADAPAVADLPAGDHPAPWPPTSRDRVEPAAGVVTLTGARSRRRPGPAWLAAAAAAVVVFAAGALVGRHTAPQVGSDTIAGGSQIASVLEVAAAGDAHFAEVDMMGARSRVVSSGEMGKSAFLASGLPTPAKGQCYQVWRVNDDGSKESAGAFVPDADGRVAVVLEGDAKGATYVITVEPPGGSTAPTGEMVGQVTT